MTSDRACAIAVFAKAAVPGAVKTRLIGQLGATGAARLHVALVRQALQVALDAGVGGVQLWATGDDAILSAVASSLDVEFRLQGSGDLGERMSHTFDLLLGEAACAILIGSDCPSRSAQDLRDAASRLAAGYDGVLGPTEDGGYHLIGLSSVRPSVFSGIDWGSGSVTEQTRARLRALGLRWHELPLRWDVDRPEDVRRLHRDPLDATLIDSLSQA